MIRQAVDQLYEEKRRADEELADIRKACPHRDVKVGWYSWRIGNMEPARICEACDSHLGRPDQAAINAFMAEEKRRQRDFLIAEHGLEAAERLLAELPNSDFWTRPIADPRPDASS
jgi:hypothetical protein